MSAYCSCVAGLSQTCNHVAAILFKVESAFRLDISNPACTTTSCSWKAPSSREKIFLRLEDMTFNKPSHKKGKSRSKHDANTKGRELNLPTRESSADSPSAIRFLSRLKQEVPNALIFLPGQLRRQRAEEAEVSDPDIIILSPTVSNTERSVDDDDADQLIDRVDVIKCAQSVNTAAELISRSTLTAEEIDQVQQSTKTQSSSTLWKTARRGRITASSFYRVYTKVQTMRRKPATSYTALVHSLIDPPALGHIAHIQHGIQSEAAAVTQIITLLKDSGHTNVTFQDCGLFIDKEFNYIGASPDGIVTCDCCGRQLVEIKSPASSDKVSCLESNGKLKTKHHYYGQVQGQMMVTGILRCLFFLYFDNISECKIQTVKYDEPFCKLLKTSLCMFYEQCMAPEIITCIQKKRRLI